MGSGEPVGIADALDHGLEPFHRPVLPKQGTDRPAAGIQAGRGYLPLPRSGQVSGLTGGPEPGQVLIAFFRQGALQPRQETHFLRDGI